MTRDADSKAARLYVAKAEEFVAVANTALDDSKYNSAVSNAIHGAINALDGLTAHYKGSRASHSHTEVLSLLQGVLDPREYSDIKKQFALLLKKKNTSEYQPDHMKYKDALDSVKTAERILARVKKKLSG